MIDNVIFELMKCFPRSFINSDGEFVAHAEGNEHFVLKTCRDRLEIEVKVLEWFSRACYKTQPFGSKQKNEKFNIFMGNGVNKFLGTDFNRDDFEIIYTKLGNSYNTPLTIEFIKRNYDIGVLRGDQNVN